MINYEELRFKNKLVNVSLLTAKEKFEHTLRITHNKLSPKMRHQVRIRKTHGYETLNVTSPGRPIK